MSENVVVYFFSLENAEGSSGCLQPARPLRRFMPLARMVEGRSLPQFIGATSDGCYAVREQGSASAAAVPKTGKSKTPFLEDSVRQTPRPVQRKVRLSGDKVSYLNWVPGCVQF